jgi:hypothetical protein
MGSESPIAPATDSPITMHQIPAEAPPLCTAVTIDDHVPGTIVRPLAGLERNVARMSCYPRYERNADFSLFALQMFLVLCEILIIYFLAAVLFLAIHHYERTVGWQLYSNVWWWQWVALRS